MIPLASLLTPGRIGSLDLPNRIILPAITTYSATGNGEADERFIHFYQKRARGQAGLLVVQCANITPETPGARHTLGIYDDRFIPGLKKLAEKVHALGARIALQVGHLGPGQAEPMRRAGWKRKLDLIAPSALPYATTGIIPREMSREDIRYIQRAFAEAARRVKDSGFDALEVHGAHGRLISMFLSPYYNRRRDEYGGTGENRARFACEVISQTKKEVGKDFPLILKMNGNDGHEGGSTITEAAYYARLFEAAGADCLCVSGGVFGFSPSIPSLKDPPAPFAPFAEKIRAAVKIPVIAVGKIDLELGEQLLQRGKADFVALGRPFLADPEIITKARAGKEKEIRRCSYCNHCLATLSTEEQPGGKGIQCPLNPLLLQENE